MAQRRRWAIIVGIILAAAGLASGQVGTAGVLQAGPLTCTPQAASTNLLRPESYAELLGELVIQCTGGPHILVGSQVPTTNLTVIVSPPTSITSRVFGGGAEGPSEALLLIDEPGSPVGTGATGPYGPKAPQVLCGPGGNCPTYVGLDQSGQYYVQASSPSTDAGGASNAANVYQGTAVSAPSGMTVITFYGVPVLPPVTTGVSRMLRITNLRVPTLGLANLATVSVWMNSSPSAILPLLQAGQYPLGTVSGALTRTIDAAPSGGQGPFKQCTPPAGTALAAKVSFQETFEFPFKTRAVPLSDSLWAAQSTNSGSPGQNVPGGMYNGFLAVSESGFVFPALTSNGFTAGLADFGTRLKAVFSNIPAGVTLYVSTANGTAPATPGGTSTSTYAVLVSSSPAGEAAAYGNNFAPIAGTVTGSDGLPAFPLTVTNGSAEAVWEIVNANFSYQTKETAAFSVYVAYAGNPPVTQGGPVPTVSLSYAPGVADGSGNAPATPILPRFGNPLPVTAQFLTIQSCAAPAISSISPSWVAAGGPDFALTVDGTGFDSGAVVRWNGALAPTTFASSTRLTAAIPSFAIASPDTVAISVLSQGVVSNSLLLTISANTAVTSLNPSSIAAGGQGFTLTVNGSGFVAGSSITWNGTALSTSFVNNTQMSAAVPAFLVASPGHAQISVSFPGGGSANALNFDITTITPTVYGIDPGFAMAGGAAFTLTVTGINFNQNATVQWNGASLSSSWVSATKLTTLVPGYLISSAGTASVAVRNPGSALSNAIQFAIRGGPAISSLNPGSVQAGGPDFTLTVAGSGFVSGSSVTWNGAALATTFVSDTQLTAAVAASRIASGGSAAIAVVNPDQSASAQLYLSIGTSTATVTSVSPASVVAGGPGITLTVNGTGFVSGSSVTGFGSATTTYVSASQLTVALPASVVATAGKTIVYVTNPGGVNSNSVDFTVTAAMPSITGFSPASAVVGSSGVTLTITGSDFDPAAAVKWEGQALPTTFVSSGKLTASVGSGLLAAVGKATVVVMNPGAQSSSAVSFAITPVAPATKTEWVLNTASGTTAIAPGSLISIYGANLAGPSTKSAGYPLSYILAGASATLDGRNLPLLFVSAGQINAQVPYEVSPGTVKLVLHSNGADSDPVDVKIAALAPGLFVVPGTNHAVAQNITDGSTNDATHPSKPGQYITAYLVGQGSLDNPISTAAAAPLNPYSCPKANVTASIGGKSATVQFAGMAPGMAGVMQLNLLVPAGVAAGDQTLQVSIGGISANAAMVTVGQ